MFSSCSWKRHICFCIQREGSIHISDGARDHFLRGSETCEDFAHAILAQGAHPEVTGVLTQEQSGPAIVDHVTNVVGDGEDLEDSHPALVAGFAALLATG